MVEKEEALLETIQDQHINPLLTDDEEHEMIMEAVTGRIEKVFHERAMHVKLIEGILKQSDDF